MNKKILNPVTKSVHGTPPHKGTNQLWNCYIKEFDQKISSPSEKDVRAIWDGYVQWKEKGASALAAIATT